MSQHDDARGQAIREFDETREVPVDGSAEARERFVHGLLWAKQEAQGAAAERRIQALLARLQSTELAAAGRTSGPTRILRTWQWLAIAATLLAFLGLGVAGWIRTDEPRALALAERAMAETERGVHMYRARFMQYDRNNRVQRERLWQIALAPGGRYHLRLERRHTPIAVASDGKITWMVPPRGHPFVIPAPMPIERYLGGLGPELSYYQLRPLLRRLLRETRLEERGYERDPSGHRFAVLEGPFENPGSEGAKGSIRLVIGVDDGRLAEAEIWAPHGTGRICYQITRSRIPEDLKAAGIRFTPPEDLSSPPGMRLGMWLGQMLAAHEERALERRNQRKTKGSSER